MQVESTRLYRVKDVAFMFSVSAATVYRLVESGELAALRFGTGKGALRVRGEDIAAYLKRAAVRTKQADGLACVVCGVDFRTTPVAHVPVGRSDTGSQVFACVTHDDPAAEADRRLALVVTGKAGA